MFGLKRKKKKRSSYEDGSIILDTGVLVFNIMALNVMWFLCSLPIVTIGASTTALNYTCIKLRRDEGESLVSMFFSSFARNIRQALILFTGMLAILIILFACTIQSIGNALAGNYLWAYLTVVLIVLMGIWFLIFTYIFMVLARFDNSMFRTVINAIYFIRSSAKTTFKVWGTVLFMIVILPIFFWEFVPYLFPMCFFFGIPTTAYLITKQFNKLFEKYVPEEELD